MSLLSNLSGSRGAEELARLLDGGAAVGPDGVLVARLRGAGAALDAAVAPRPEFRDALRMRLVAVATVQAAAAASAARATPAARPRALEAAVSWSTGRRAGRGSAVAAGAMAGVVAVSGIAVAGSQSLPGDPFYGVKRTTEAFQLRTADGDVEKGTRHLDLAATRLREVRGLTLGRGAVDAGPQLGTSALGSSALDSGGIVLRSASQPLADGAALSPEVADRVRATLAEMDEQTRDGSALLTRAYRSSRSAEPLRALSRFATRQSAGLEQLLPALPPAAKPRARVSLALLTDVRSSTDELLSIGTCGAACDPSSAAPTLPQPGSSTTTGTPGTAGCECPQPAPAPAPSSTPTPEPTTTTSAPQPEPTRSPEPSPEPEPTTASSPSPSPSPSSSTLPVPVPTTPVPLPTLPVPLPTPTLTLAPAPLEPTLDINRAPAEDAPAPAPAPTATPQLAPLPVRQ